MRAQGRLTSEDGLMPGRHEPKMNDEARSFVVQSLAMYDPPSTVRDAVRQEFGFAVTAQTIESYDPTKRAGKTLATKWRDLFEATRAEFLKETAAIGISHRAVRLRILQRLVEKTEKQGNVALTATLLEQAAKESGGAFTNQRVLSAPGGGPAFQNVNVNMTAKEAADSYADLVRGAGG